MENMDQLQIKLSVNIIFIINPGHQKGSNEHTYTTKYKSIDWITAENTTYQRS